MGKGDRKSRKGKIWRGSNGIKRLKHKNKAAAAPVVAKAENKPVAAAAVKGKP